MNDCPHCGCELTPDAGGKPSIAKEEAGLAGYFRDAMTYDPETGVMKWKTTRNGQALQGATVGHVNIDGYIVVNIGGYAFKGHRIAWLISYGDWPSHEIDHVNGNKSDNRLSNLRNVTRLTNQSNQTRLRRNNTSGAPGVWLHNQTNKWLCQIGVSGKRFQVGLFSSKDEASAAYATAKSIRDACYATGDPQ